MSDERPATALGGVQIIRAGWVLAGEHAEDVIRDGCVVIADGMIKDVGPERLILRAYPDAEVRKYDDHVAIPGFVNAHQHGLGLSSYAAGYPDLPLERWVLRRYAPHHVDVYLDTLFAAVRMLRSGVTTVVHSHYYRGPADYSENIEAALQAYRDAGIRVVFAPNIADQNYLVYGDTDAFLSRVPPAAAKHVRNRTAQGWGVDRETYFGIVESLVHRARDWPLVSIGFAPVAGQWCSDSLLEDIATRAERWNLVIHTHLLETLFQRAYALKAYGKTLVAHLAEIGFLTPRVSCAHAVWLTVEDVDIIRQSGAALVHNPSSNLRLGSGIAPLAAYRRAGVRLGLGTDNISLNDDEDFLQEMRLAYLLSAMPSISDPPVDAKTVWSIASRGGADALLLGTLAGSISVGRSADIALVSTSRIADYPSLERLALHDQLLHFASARDVTSVFVGGRELVRDGVVSGFDVMGLERQVIGSIQHADHADLTQLHRLDEAVQNFYRDWASEEVGRQYRVLT